METCYRHPNRETGVACSNCGRPICPECMTSTSVGMRCPQCATQKTKVRVGAGAFSAAGVPAVTYGLIAINVIVFLAEITTGPGGLFDVLPNDVADHGGLLGPAVADGDYWRIVSAGFIHAGIIHLALNMYVLYVAGTLLEPGIGRGRFLGLYFVSLLAGSFLALVVDPHSNTVGASGAIFGLMAAAVVIARGRGRDDVAQQFGLFVVINLFLTFSVSGISIGGHIGGLIGGGIAALAIVAIERRGSRGGALPLEVPALVLLGLVSVAGSLLAANAA
ncbi:MAG: rhomboid family intramembrane serine protease [Solirubrobacterales bacterium]